MIVAPPPCVAIEDVLCVVAPFSDTLKAQRGISPPPLVDANRALAKQSAYEHRAAVRRLGAEILDDGGDAVMIEVPAPDESTFCAAGLCIRYSFSCGGKPAAQYCDIVLHLPYPRERGREPNDDTLMRREVRIQARSQQALAAAIGATYVVPRLPGSNPIPMNKLIPLNRKVPS